MLRFSQRLSVILIVFLTFINAAHADIQLPTAQMENGISLFDALKKRSSTPGGAFGIGKITDQELSTILWAASGLNRGEKGWTIPTASGQAPYVKIYVAGEKGVYLYQWQGHYLQQLSDEDIRGDIAFQNFTRRAAYQLIFVSDSQALKNFNDDVKANNFSQIAVGAMSQNIYLAAAALKLNVRYIHSIKPEIIEEELKLGDDKPIGMMLLSK